MLMLKDLKQMAVFGLGLLSGEIALAVSQSFPHTKVEGFSHLSSTRARAIQLPETVYYVASHPKSRIGAKPNRQDHFGIDKTYECCQIQKQKEIKRILERARCKRAALIKYKMNKKELVS